MTEKQYDVIDKEEPRGQSVTYEGIPCTARMCVSKLNRLTGENERLKKELKRCKDWLNSDKNDYQLTLAFIKSKGYSLKDVLEYGRSWKND